MGNETIFYYVTEETATGHKREEKTYPWKKMRLFTYRAEADEMILIVALIPTLQKEWKKEKLQKQMRKALEKSAEEYPYDTERAEIILQPQVQQMLMRSDTLPTIFWGLAGKLLDSCREKNMETVILMLGDTLFPEEQMRRFFDMMQSYLSRINHLTILYTIGRESEDAALWSEGEYPGNADFRNEREYSGSADFRNEREHSWSADFRNEREHSWSADFRNEREHSWNADFRNEREHSGNADFRNEREHSGSAVFRSEGEYPGDATFRNEEERLEEALSEYTEELYYEYGLVAQLMRAGACTKDLGRGNAGSGKAGGKGYAGDIFFLDYGYAGDIPIRALRAGDIYLDVFSSGKKEMLLKRKCAEVSYLSPGKYLDTVVKSEYDKLVNDVRNRKK